MSHLLFQYLHFFRLHMHSSHLHTVHWKIQEYFQDRNILFTDELNDEIMLDEFDCPLGLIYRQRIAVVFGDMAAVHGASSLSIKYTLLVYGKISQFTSAKIRPKRRIFRQFDECGPHKPSPARGRWHGEAVTDEVEGRRATRQQPQRKAPFCKKGGRGDLTLNARRRRF